MDLRTDQDGTGPERDDLLEALFHEALELEGAKRAAYIRRQCAGDLKLAEELSALLAAHRKASPGLEQPAWGERELGLEERPGDTVGKYHLLRTLGEGGMGTVYLAQQLRPLRRVVALKLIKPGMDTREVVARFDAERQALAQLNHSNVAAVYDAGVTARGRPYFAMEYVPGEPITRYCDARKLTIRQRLRLFRSVCDAVHHAHQKGIVHRDLKPSNILLTEVDGQPVSKIIDFGVAKAMHGGSGRGGLGTVCTRSGQIVGTPSYMSPEQAGAFPATVDSRTDVYSLGVLLNELLTGFLPYDLGSLRGVSDEVIRRRLSEVEAVRPALRVATFGLRARRAAAQRGCDPNSLCRLLRGDLDWIVLKALDRNPEERYASASELAADIANHLEGEPVTASSPGALYMLRKLVAKNRVAVASVAGLIIVGFVGLMGFAMNEADRNEELLEKNSELVSSHDVQMQVVLDQQDQLLAACDAARDEIAVEPPFSTAVIRNMGDSPLLVGELVELLGTGENHPLGDMVVNVVRASADSGRPPLGSMYGLWAEQEGHDGHAHRLVEAVPPGEYGVVVTHGLFARVRVDGSCGEIYANDPLGVSAIPGLACRHAGKGAVVGFALEEWTVAQRGLIRAFLAPLPELVAAQVDQLDPALSHTSMETAFTPSVPGKLRADVSEEGGLPKQFPVQEVTSADESVDGEAALAEVFRGSHHNSQAAQGEQEPALTDGEVSSSELPVGAAHASDSPPAGGGAKSKPPLPFLPFDGTALVVGSSGLAGGQSGEFREHGVGRRAPGETGGRTNTPPDSDDPPGLSGDDLPEQGDGKDFELVSELEGVGGLAEEEDVYEEERTDVASGSGTTRDPLIQLWGDVDGDGLLDVLIQAGDENLSLHRNVGRGSFQDITVWSGLGEYAPGVERAVAWIDLEADGNLDLLAVSVSKHLRLFRGRGAGRFDEISEIAGLGFVEGVEDVTPFDVDGNGTLDLRVSIAGNGLLLLLSDGAGRFRPVVLRAADSPEIPEVSVGGGLDPEGTLDH